MEVRTLKRVHGATLGGIAGGVLPWVIRSAVGLSGLGFALLRGA